MRTHAHTRARAFHAGCRQRPLQHTPPAAHGTGALEPNPTNPNPTQTKPNPNPNRSPRQRELQQRRDDDDGERRRTTTAAARRRRRRRGGYLAGRAHLLRLDPLALGRRAAVRDDDRVGAPARKLVEPRGNRREEDRKQERGRNRERSVQIPAWRPPQRSARGIPDGGRRTEDGGHTCAADTHT